MVGQLARRESWSSPHQYPLCLISFLSLNVQGLTAWVILFDLIFLVHWVSFVFYVRKRFIKVMYHMHSFTVVQYGQIFLSQFVSRIPPCCSSVMLLHGHHY